MEGKENREVERCIYGFLKVIAIHINVFITTFPWRKIILHYQSFFFFYRLCLKISCDMKPGKFCTNVCTNKSSCIGWSESNASYFFSWKLQ